MSQPPARRDVSDVDAIAATATYRELIERPRRRIRESQARAAQALTELVMLYWSIGRDIVAQQQASHWGDDVVGRIAEDLREGPGATRGYTRRNRFYKRRFTALWTDPEKVPSVMARIGWTAHRILLDSFAISPTSTRGTRPSPPRTAGRYAISRPRSTSAPQTPTRRADQLPPRARTGRRLVRRCRPRRIRTSSTSSSSKRTSANASSSRR
jgi:hypothetical protein